MRIAPLTSPQSPAPASAVRLTLLHIYCGIHNRHSAKAGIQKGKETGFRVKPGMTNNVKGFMMQYTRFSGLSSRWHGSGKNVRSLTDHVESAMKYLIHFLPSLLVLLCLFPPVKAGQQKGKEKPDPHGDLFTQKCTHCHDLTLVEEAHKTRTNAEMKEILILHKDKPGSEITKKDLKAFLKLY